MQGGPHILIVDDHREIRDLVSRALTKEGFRVSAAADGRAMRKVLADSRIDLIVLDLMLPGEDGLSICRSLRVGSSIPIIMLTAKAAAASSSRASGQSCDAARRPHRGASPPKHPSVTASIAGGSIPVSGSCSETMASPLPSARENTIC
jgi:CheY-like chemotaxis protein